MKDFLHKFWTIITGALSSLSFKGITDIALQPDITESAQEITRRAISSPQHSLITYLWIGMLGAFGGLVIKILWGCIKKIFPRLKNIDK